MKEDTNLRRKKINQDRIYFVLGCISLCLLFALVLYLSITAKNNLQVTILDGGILHYILIVLFLFNIFFAIKNKYFFWLYVIVLFCFFLWFSFADTSYSVCDEVMNFESINRVADMNSLPTFQDKVNYVFLNEANNGINFIGDMTNYEAVQAPVYYMIFGLLAKFMGSAYIRFHILRVLSLCLVLAVYFFLNKTVMQVKRTVLPNMNMQIYRMGLLLTIFSPGYLIRASRLNNEILVCLLLSIFVYFAIICFSETWKRQNLWIMSLLCVLLFLTKNTTIYVYVAFAFLVIIQKRIKEAIIPVISTGLLTLPWFAFNWYHYKSLTAMQQHLDYVIPIINPTHKKVHVLEAIYNCFTSNFFTGEEAFFTSKEQLILRLFLFVVIFVFLFAFVPVLRDIKRYKFHVEKYATISRINGFCITLVLACLLCLVAATMKTNINSVIGRYFYGPSIVIVILLVVNVKEEYQKINVAVVSIIIILLTVTTTRMMITFMDRAYTNNKVFGENIKELPLANVTNEMWKNGYSSKNKELLIEMSDSTKYEAYQNLVGRELQLDNETVLVTKITREVIANKDNYIGLMINKSLEKSTKKNQKIILGTTYGLANYNTAQIDALLGEIQNKQVEQTVTIKKTGKIRGIELEGATYGVVDYEAKVSYGIFDKNGKTLENGSINSIVLQDNTKSMIAFDHPVKVEKGEVYHISITCSNQNNLPLTLHASQNNSYQQGELYIDGVEQVNKDLSFSILEN